MDRQILMQMMAQSISNVFETAFFQSVEARTIDGDILSQMPPSEKLTGACLAFSGMLSGRACILSPDSWLRQTTADFLGTDAQAITEIQKQDTIKEAINMIVGHMFSLIETSADIKLGIPALMSDTALSREALKRLKGQALHIFTDYGVVVTAFDA